MVLCFLNVQWWLSVTDYYSCYPDLFPLGSLTRAAVVNHCKSIFSKHRIPDVEETDNGHQFSNTRNCEFAKCARQYILKQVPSSQYYPQSNGHAEDAVKIIKGSFEK